jgi:hypothetical protein
MATSVTLRVDMDVENLLVRMRNGQKKLAYGAVAALNDTAKRIQQLEFEHVRAEFIIRKPDFFFGSAGRPGGAAARIESFASVKQGRPYVDIVAGTAPRGGSGGKRILLGIFEQGGQRPRLGPGAKSAIPLTGSPARPSRRAAVPADYTFRALAFRPFQGARRLRRRRKGGTGFSNLREGAGAVQWKGKRGTFIAKTQKEPEGAVFQRIGTERGDIRELYPFRDPPQLDSRLDFVLTGENAAPPIFADEMKRQLGAAFAHEAARAAA